MDLRLPSVANAAPPRKGAAYWITWSVWTKKNTTTVLNSKHTILVQDVLKVPADLWINQSKNLQMTVVLWIKCKNIASPFLHWLPPDKIQWIVSAATADSEQCNKVVVNGATAENYRHYFTHFQNNKTGGQRVSAPASTVQVNIEFCAE